MRPIKFRIWDKYDKYHLKKQPSMLQIRGIMTYSNTDKYDIGFMYGRGMFARDEFELMQYTGLKDKNGKEIYEGDICSTDLSRPYLIVVYRNGAFMYQCHDNGKDYFDLMIPIGIESDIDKYTEVIGNLYENPELVGGW